MPVRLIDAGTVPYLRSQTVYHGVASVFSENTPDTIILAIPAQPYVCIGYHQTLEREVDTVFCQENNIPIVRREVGGGAVYLDKNQLFTQWVFDPNRIPRHMGRRFELFVDPLIATYKALGIEANFRPINDIQVAGKKIAGTGAAAIGNAEVLVGNLLFDFDFDIMTHVLRAPSASFREQVAQGLQSYMTTIKKELGVIPDFERVKATYIQHCATALNREIVEGTFTEQELTAIGAYDDKFASPSWLFQEGGLDRKGVKIHEDVWVFETTHQTSGGVIHATTRVRNGLIDAVTFSGDFVFDPLFKVPALEKALVDTKIIPEPLAEAVHRFYDVETVHTPGITPDDWVQAILKIPSAKHADG